MRSGRLCEQNHMLRSEQVLRYLSPKVFETRGYSP
jgi:hypothetical protein